MYIPKNRIKPNQYTTGQEYIVVATGEDYIGFYYSLWDGKFFTGKNQNDKPNQQLIPYVAERGMDTEPLPPGETSTNTIALFLEDPDPLIDQDNDTWNQTDIVTYLELKEMSTTDDQPRETPSQSYPRPTIDDYQLGSFTRYFCVKVNEAKYMELDVETFDLMKKQDKKIVWELYRIFNIQWTLIGEEKTVAKTNLSQILIAEQRLKKKGLNRFLRGNYLKFYKNPTNDISVTESQTEIQSASIENQMAVNKNVQDYNTSKK
jgi:hypothetical protein